MVWWVHCRPNPLSVNSKQPYGGQPPYCQKAKARLRAEHAQLNPFTLKKNIEQKLRLFFTAHRNLQLEMPLSSLTNAASNLYP